MTDVSPTPSARSIGRRDVTEWRSRTGKRLLGAQRRLAERRNRRAAIGMTLDGPVLHGAISLRTRSPLPAATVVVAGLGSLLTTIGGTSTVQRHRPARQDAIAPFEHSPSFPSGHTLNATVVTGVLASLLMLEQRSNVAQVATGTAAAGVAAGVALSRVLLGAHWFTDVLTGWAAGVGRLAVVVTTHRLHLTPDQDSAH